MNPALWPAARRRTSIALLATVAVVVATIAMPMVAWARYAVAGPERNVFATHVLLAPPQLTCSGLGVLTVTLNWTAPSDTTYFTSYELGQSVTSGSGYSYTDVGLVTSKTKSIPLGDQYFVVRTVNHQWRGSLSPERHVVGLAIVATCS